jgi:hypothetical protein
LKNNSLAMIALIALVGAPASLIGYIDPKTCPVQSETFITCQQAADQHIWLFWGLLGFSVVTFAASYLRRRISAKRR